MRIALSNAVRGEHSASKAAFTLIELIGVMVVILILASVMLPSLSSAADDAAVAAEITELKEIEEAFLRYVKKNRIVPGSATWAAAVATQLDRSETAIATNPRGLARQFVVHPSIAPTLPYTQTSSGRTLPATNALVLLVSSVNPNLPVPNPAATTGAQFTNLWNLTPNAVPSHFPSTWTGNGSDLVVQRINVGELFHELIMNYYVGVTNTGYYTIDGSGLLSFNSTFTRYYLHGTVMGFAGVDESLTNVVVHGRQIIETPSTFNFVRGAWRSGLAVDLIAPFEVPDHSDMEELAEISTEFMASELNPDHSLPSPASLQLIINAFTNYVTKYISWANAGYPTSNTGGTRNELRNATPPLITVTEQLITF